MAIETYFEDIADAIRERGGTSAALTPAAMPQAILDIPGGGDIDLNYRSISSTYQLNLVYTVSAEVV